MKIFQSIVFCLALPCIFSCQSIGPTDTAHSATTLGHLKTEVNLTAIPVAISGTIGVGKKTDIGILLEAKEYTGIRSIRLKRNIYENQNGLSIAALGGFFATTLDDPSYECKESAPACNDTYDYDGDYLGIIVSMKTPSDVEPFFALKRSTIRWDGKLLLNEVEDNGTYVAYGIKEDSNSSDFLELQVGFLLKKLYGGVNCMIANKTVCLPAAGLSHKF